MRSSQVLGSFAEERLHQSNEEAPTSGWASQGQCAVELNLGHEPPQAAFTKIDPCGAEMRGNSGIVLQ